MAKLSPPHPPLLAPGEHRSEVHVVALGQCGKGWTSGHLLLRALLLSTRLRSAPGYRMTQRKRLGSLAQSGPNPLNDEKVYGNKAGREKLFPLHHKCLVPDRDCRSAVRRSWAAQLRQQNACIEPSYSVAQAWQGDVLGGLSTVLSLLNHWGGTPAPEEVFRTRLCLLSLKKIAFIVQMLNYQR